MKSRFPTDLALSFIGSAREALLASINFFKKFAEHSFKFGAAQNRLGGPEAQLIWQYLRFNPHFRSEVDALQHRVDVLSQTLEKRGFPGEDIADSVGDHEVAFARKWALSRFVHYNTPLLPKQTTFRVNAFEQIRSGARVKQAARLEMFRDIWVQDDSISEAGVEPIVLAINPFADPGTTAEAVSRLIEAELRKNEKYLPAVNSGDVKGSASSHLFENLICYYFHKVRGKEFRAVKELYSDILGAGYVLQQQQMNRKIRQFEKTSAAAPWCFMRKFAK